MLKRVGVYNVLPFLIAVLLCWVCIKFFVYFSNAKDIKPLKNKILISGKQSKIKGFLPNLSKGKQPEVEYFTSIKSKETLTIFGSSEFSSSAYCAFNFLPDTLGIQALGIGHAYHQSFSILCELLAAEDYLEGANIALIVSPGWFEEEGTKPQAFTEFATKTILTQIWQNPNVKDKYKQLIGKYIHEHKSEFKGSSYIYDCFRYNYVKSSKDHFFMRILLENKAVLQEVFKETYTIDTVICNLETISTLTQIPWKHSHDIQLKEKRKAFNQAIHKNKIYVNDEYYLKYLLKKGKEKKGKVKQYSAENNQEFEDLMMVLDYLKEKKANVSLVMQPLNPYYYSGLENHEAIIKRLTNRLKEDHTPFLNMYTTKKEDYKPGTLKDVMHLGGAGWLEVNRFLNTIYNPKQ